MIRLVFLFYERESEACKFLTPLLEPFGVPSGFYRGGVTDPNHHFSVPVQPLTEEKKKKENVKRGKTV